jgi:hypothetical protein
MLLELAQRPLDPDRIVAGFALDPDPATADGLRRLCASAEAGAGLTLLGRLALLDRIVVALRTRAALDALPDAPPLRQPPILIVGAPRSGTTLLHRTLAQHPDLRALALWELMYPLTLGRWHDRRREATDRVRRLRRHAPGLHHLHPLDVDAPEECLWLMEPSLRSASFWPTFPVPDYARWLADADLEATYDVYGQLIRHLAAAAPERRLVLKGPGHARWIPHVRRALPGVVLVWMHREPADVLPSLSALFARAHGAVAPAVDTDRTDAFNRRILLRHLDSDREVGAQHVRFVDLIADPVAVGLRVQRAVGLEPVPLGPPFPLRAPEPRAQTVFGPEAQAGLRAYRERRL